MSAISSLAFDAASRKMEGYETNKVDQDGHSWSYHYQIELLERFSEEEIIAGMFSAYNEHICVAKHHRPYPDHLPTDECRMFQHPNGGGRDHFNMRWFKEWCENNNPRILQVLQRYCELKVFW